MATIYLDTNIILNESYFRSHFSQAFLKACALLKIDVVVPDIVIDEVMGNYPSALKSRLKNLQKYQKEIGRLVEIEQIEVSVDQAFSDYEDFLYGLIDKFGIDIAPYPKISPKDLVLKSYEKLKPFKDTGDGHKDFLVWQSIKLHLEAGETSPPYFFVTNNTKDFGEQDKEKKEILHHQLSSQIESPEKVPALILSLREAWESLLAPKLEGMSAEDIPDLSNDDIREATSKFLLDDLPGYNAFGFEGLPFGNDVSISMVGSDEISEITFTKIDDEVVIKVVGSVELEVSGFMEKHTYYLDLEDSKTADVSVHDSDWNDHVMWVGATIDTEFELSIFYSLADSEIVGHEIELPQEIEDDWYK